MCLCVCICVVINVRESVDMGVMRMCVQVGVCMDMYQSILGGLKVPTQTS